MLISLFSSLQNRRAVGKTVGKLSERKLMTSLLVHELKKCGDFETVLVSSSQRWISEENPGVLMAINCKNNSKSKFSTFKFTQDSNLKREWLIAMKRECFPPSKNLFVCTELWVSFSSNNLTVRSFIRTLFYSKKRRYWWFVTSVWKVASPQLKK